VNVRDLFDLTGKVAVVTGGARGLGLQMADALAELGADVVVCGRKADRCEAAAAALASAHGVKALGLGCDIAVPDEIEALVERTVEELGGLDVLVNNAGTSWGAPAIDHPLGAWEKVIRVNLTGLFLLSQAVAGVMRARGGGKIVNIASAAAFVGMPAEVMDAAAYTASKGGVISLTRDIAVKWAPYGITVNAIAPGWFPSDMSRAVVERHERRLLDEIPLGRLGGDTDLKGAIAFLASAASDFVTGAVLPVDGGQTAR
jgi:NAD(P)-dependent dehydrogenase (short-subunit alcohol dehydrogenase family)